MQRNVANQGSLAQMLIASAGSKGNGAGASEDFGSIVEKNFVHDPGSQRGPVYQRAAFDKQARDLHFAKARRDVLQVRAAVVGPQGYLLHANAPSLEVFTFVLLGERA